MYRVSTCHTTRFDHFWYIQVRFSIEFIDSLCFFVSAINNTCKINNPLALEDIRRENLGIPVPLPPFNPDTDVPDAPDYTNVDSWLTMPVYFSTEE